MSRSRIIGQAMSVLVLLAPAALLTAQQTNPIAANGVQKARLYEGAGPDSVDLFNGNLMFSVPIGETLPVGPDLAISPTLTFNSKGLKRWSVRFGEGNGQCGNGPPSELIAADGDRIFGGGWQLHFGRLVSTPGSWSVSLCIDPPAAPDGNAPQATGFPAFRMGDTYLAYQSPDGAVHQFYDREFEAPCNLADSACVTPDPPDCAALSRKDASSTGHCFYYTHDGSHLLLDPIDPDHGKSPTVYFPDGSIAELQYQRGRHPASFNDTFWHGDFEYAWYSGEVWNTTQQLDRFGNSVRILYYGMAGAPAHPLQSYLPDNENQWEAIPYRVFPGNDESRYIQFSAQVEAVPRTMMAGGTLVSRTHYVPTISSISVPTSARSGTTPLRATYTFLYSYNSSGVPSSDPFPHPRLDRIVRPDGSYYGFEYVEDSLFPAATALAVAHTPTGADITYTYEPFGFLARREDCELECFQYDFVGEPYRLAVTKRTFGRPIITSYSQPMMERAETEYFRSYPAGTCSPTNEEACRLRVDVFRPPDIDGNRLASRSLFWPSDWIQHSKFYGRAISTCNYRVNAEVTASATALDGQAPQTCTYYTYDGDGHNGPGWPIDDSSYGFNHNTRVTKERTVWCSPQESTCSVGRYFETERAGWDGYGHFQNVASRESEDGQSVRVLRTVDETYLNSTPTEACPTCWILTPPTSRTTSRPSESGLDPQGANLSTSETFEYESSTGFRLAQQIVNQEPEGTRTLRHEWVKGVETAGHCLEGSQPSTQCSNLGFPTSQVDTLTGSFGPYPVNSSYTRSFFYRYGTLAAAHDGTGFYVLDKDLTVTGKAVGERGPEGRSSLSDTTPELTTLRQYDLLGRVTSITPPGEGPEEISYPEGRNVFRTKRDGAGNVVSRSEQGFDAYGRPIFERILQPDGEWACRITTYDAAGNRVGVTNWIRNGDIQGDVFSPQLPAPWADDICEGGAYQAWVTSAGPRSFSIPPGTTFTGFDFLRRPTHVVLADGTSSGSASEGWWRQDLTRQFNTDSTATTTVRRNALGEVVSVVEPPTLRPGRSDAMNPEETTTYRYDHVGRLLSATKPGSAAFGAVATSQVRTFRFDDFGWLLSQSAPEHSDLQVPSRDARGNALITVDGVATILRTYDTAGRPLTSRMLDEYPPYDWDGQSATWFEVFAYDSHPSFQTGYSNGRPVWAFRANHVVTNAGTVESGWSGVADFFHYNGVGGRLSFRQQSDRGLEGPWVEEEKGDGRGEAGLRDALWRYYDGQARTANSLLGFLGDLAPEFRSGPPVLGSPSFPNGTARWRYQWDTAGRLQSITYPRRDEGYATTVSYGYTNGFPTSITASFRDPFEAAAVEAVTASLLYDDSGRVKSTVVATSSAGTTAMSISTGADASGIARLGTWQLSAYADPRNSFEETRTYSYDASGNLTSIESTLPDRSSASSYDSRGRLVWDDLGLQSPQTREYDSFGNMVGVVGGRAFPTDRASNQLAPSLARYDAAGRMIEDASRAQSSGDWSVGRDYYPDGLLTSEYSHWPNDPATASPQGIAYWLLDAAGENALSVWLDGSDCKSEQFRTTIRDNGGTLLTEYRGELVNGSCTCGVNCTHASRFHSDIVRLGPWASAVYTRGVGLRLEARDQLGTPRYVTDADGVVTAFVGLDSFGNRIGGTGDGASRECFTGQERHHLFEDGPQLPSSDYMHARTYVPMLGRFTRPDPANSFSLFDPQSLNGYTYARNNPVTYVDPDGRSSVRFDPDTHSMTIFGRGMVATFPAANRPANEVQPYLGKRVARLQRGGVFRFLDTRRPRTHGNSSTNGIRDDSYAGAYGTRGIFRLSDYRDRYGWHNGVGIHAGRLNDYCHKTLGCIRTTEEAMDFLAAVAEVDPLEYLWVAEDVGPFSPDPWSHFSLDHTPSPARRTSLTGGLDRDWFEYMVLQFRTPTGEVTVTTTYRPKG